MNRLLALAVLFSFQLHAAVPIAPLDPIRGPVAHTDTDAVSATNGDSTLAVWDNFPNPYLEGYTIWARLLDSGDDRDAFVVARGHGPRVATNGTDYLIAYATTVSRFSAHFRPTIMARVVHAGGTLGDSIYIHHSTQVYPSMRGVAWSGSKWTIAFGDPEPMVAVVSADLHDVRIVELAGSPIRDLVTIGGKTFAIRNTADRLEAIEIREDATIGVTYSIAGADGKIVATSANAATVFFATGAASFTADHGFGTPTVFPDALDFVDAIATADGGALLLHYDAAAKVLAVTGFAGATAGTTTTVLAGIDPYHHARLGATKNGPVLYYSFTTDFSVQFNDDLYAYSLAPPRPYALDEGTLISITNRATQSMPVLASNGTNVIAFWLQSITAGRSEWFSRMLDPDGNPTGEIVQLPSGAFASDSVAFDGKRFVMIGGHGIIRAITISANGRTATEPVEIGRGSYPAIASGSGGTFAIWKDETNQLRGTPLRDDATPHVPGGFSILSSVSPQDVRIVALGTDFLILWDEGGVQSAMISAAGTLISSRSDPNWGLRVPRAILPMANDRFLVVTERDGVTWASEITMSGASIAAIGPRRSLGRYPDSFFPPTFAMAGDKVIVGYEQRSRAMITTSPRPRPRAARH